MMELKYYSGYRLPLNSFLAYQKDMVTRILDAEVENLGLTTLFPPYMENVKALQQFVDTGHGSALTNSVEVLDKVRDHLLSAFMSALRSLATLPQTHELFQPAHLAYVKLKKYTGSQDMEYSLQADKMDNFVRDATTEDILDALDKIKLKDLFNNVLLAIHEWRMVYRSRQEEHGVRLNEKEGFSSAKVRKELQAQLKEMVKMVNAVYMTTTDAEKKAVIEDFITKANGVADQYRKVQANLNKMPKEEGEGNATGPEGTESAE